MKYYYAGAFVPLQVVAWIESRKNKNPNSNSWNTKSGKSRMYDDPMFLIKGSDHTQNQQIVVRNLVNYIRIALWVIFNHLFKRLDEILQSNSYCNHIMLVRNPIIAALMKREHQNVCDLTRICIVLRFEILLSRTIRGTVRCSGTLKNLYTAPLSSTRLRWNIGTHFYDMWLLQNI